MNNLVLIVEDYENTGEALVHLCNAWGYEAERVESAKAAIPLLDHNPCACFVDLMLPDGPGAGEDLIYLIRERLPDCRVIVWSGYVTEALKARLQEVGVYAYLEKPPKDGIESIQWFLP